MSRRLCLTWAACFSLAALNLTPAQTPTAADDPAGNDVVKLQAENAALKKEVSDAQQTITKLQAQLAQNGTPAPADAGTAAPVTPGMPAGPQKALPLDATNAVTTPGAPGAAATDAGPSKTYTVVKGDKLWTIAKRMYPGHTKEGVEKIQEANKDTLGTKPLKIGQVLIIPQ